MANKTTTLRLRRVRFKNGRTIEVFRPPQKLAMGQRLQDSVADALSRESNISAYVLVAWREKGSCYIAYGNECGSGIPEASLPNITRDALVAEMGARWSQSE